MNVVQGRQKILIVDDEPLNVRILTDALKEDYAIETAYSGEEAIQIVGSGELPDLILLDIVMLDMDGYEVCAKLKSHEGTKHIPIIFTTAKSQVEDETRGLEVGAVDYITKPFSFPILKARVKTHLELKAAQTILIASAHQTGRLEMAETFIHSIGNILNSLHIRVAQINKYAESLRVQTPRKLAHLIADKKGDLRSYFSDEDSHLLGVLHTFAQILDTSQKEILENVTFINERLEQVEAMLNLQQTYRNVREEIVTVSVSSVIHDALQIMHQSTEPTMAIQFETHCEDGLMVKLNKLRLLQILLRILGKSVDAIQAAQTHDHELKGIIHLKTKRLNPTSLSIQVKDNGIGLSPSQQRQLFDMYYAPLHIQDSSSSLHECANYIISIGGTINAHSEGYLCGTTISITLGSYSAEKLG